MLINYSNYYNFFVLLRVNIFKNKKNTWQPNQQKVQPIRLVKKLL